MAFCDYDVVVVGGGIIGLSTARFLVKLGCKTLLLDQVYMFNAVFSCKATCFEQ